MFYFIIPFSSLSCFFFYYFYLKKKPLPPIFIHFSYKSIYLIIYYISKAQIIFNKTILLLNPIINYIKTLFIKKSIPNKDSEYIDFIYQGKEIYHCSKQDMNIKKPLFPPKFDFILYSQIDKNEIIHKKIIYHYPLNSNDFEIEKTDYTFLLVELKLYSFDLKLDLQSKKNKINFFIVDNKFNASFIYYFLNKYNSILSIDFPSFVENFSLQIIDDSINRKEIFYLDEILLKKTNYKISNIFHDTFQNKISDSFSLQSNLKSLSLEKPVIEEKD